MKKSTPAPHDAQRAPASAALVTAIDAVLQRGRQLSAQIQQESDAQINQLALLSKAENAIPDALIYDHAQKAWITPPAKA